MGEFSVALPACPLLPVLDSITPLRLPLRLQAACTDPNHAHHVRGDTGGRCPRLTPFSDQLDSVCRVNASDGSSSSPLRGAPPWTRPRAFHLSSVPTAFPELLFAQMWPCGRTSSSALPLSPHQAVRPVLLVTPGGHGVGFLQGVYPGRQGLGQRAHEA